MEITIDTNKDSKEHIQHMIEFLQRFVSAQASQQQSAGDGGGVMGMFGSSAGEAEASGLAGMFGDDAQGASREDDGDEDPETPRIEIF